MFLLQVQVKLSGGQDIFQRWKLACKIFYNGYAITACWWLPGPLDRSIASGFIIQNIFCRCVCRNNCNIDPLLAKLLIMFLFAPKSITTIFSRSFLPLIWYGSLHVTCLSGQYCRFFLFSCKPDSFFAILTSCYYRCFHCSAFSRFYREHTGIYAIYSWFSSSFKYSFKVRFDLWCDGWSQLSLPQSFRLHAIWLECFTA